MNHEAGGGYQQKPTDMTAFSGETCPCSGEWEIIGTPSTTSVFAKGSRVSEYYGKKVWWVLVRSG